MEISIENEINQLNELIIENDLNQKLKLNENINLQNPQNGKKVEEGENQPKNAIVFCGKQNEGKSALIYSFLGKNLKATYLQGAKWELGPLDKDQDSIEQIEIGKKDKKEKNFDSQKFIFAENSVLIEQPTKQKELENSYQLFLFQIMKNYSHIKFVFVFSFDSLNTNQFFQELEKFLDGFGDHLKQNEQKFKESLLLVLTKAPSLKEETVTIEQCWKNMVEYIHDVDCEFKYKEFFKDEKENILQKNLILVKKPLVQNADKKFEAQFQGLELKDINFKEMVEKMPYFTKNENEGFSDDEKVIPHQGGDIKYREQEQKFIEFLDQIAYLIKKNLDEFKEFNHDEINQKLNFLEEKQQEFVGNQLPQFPNFYKKQIYQQIQLIETPKQKKIFLMEQFIQILQIFNKILFQEMNFQQFCIQDETKKTINQYRFLKNFGIHYEQIVSRLLAIGKNGEVFVKFKDNIQFLSIFCMYQKLHAFDQIKQEMVSLSKELDKKKIQEFLEKVIEEITQFILKNNNKLDFIENNFLKEKINSQNKIDELFQFYFNGLERQLDCDDKAKIDLIFKNLKQIQRLNNNELESFLMKGINQNQNSLHKNIYLKFEEEFLNEIFQKENGLITIFNEYLNQNIKRFKFGNNLTPTQQTSYLSGILQIKNDLNLQTIFNKKQDICKSLKYLGFQYKFLELDFSQSQKILYESAIDEETRLILEDKFEFLEKVRILYQKTDFGGVLREKIKDGQNKYKKELEIIQDLQKRITERILKESEIQKSKEFIEQVDDFKVLKNLFLGLEVFEQNQSKSIWQKQILLKAVSLLKQKTLIEGFDYEKKDKNVALDLIWFYSNLIKVDFSDLYMEELGEIYLKLKLYLKAVPYLKKAERFQRCKFCFQQLLLLSEGDASKKAEVYEKWGDYYTSINLFEKSRSRYQDSLSVLLRPEEEKRQLIRKKFEATFFFETKPKQNSHLSSQEAHFILSNILQTNTFTSPSTLPLPLLPNDSLSLLQDQLSIQIKENKIHGINSARCVSVSSDNQLIATGGGDYKVHIFDKKQNKVIQTLSDHSDWVWIVCFSNDSSLLVSGSEDKTLKLFSTKNWSKLQDYKENTGYVRCSVFSPDDSIIASGSEDNSIKIWSPSQSNSLKTLQKHTGYVLCLAFTQKGDLLASGSADKSVIIWGVKEWQIVQQLTLHESSVFSLQFFKSDLELVIGHQDGTCLIAQWQNKQILQKNKLHSGEVRALQISTDQTQVISFSYDKNLVLWQKATGKEDWRHSHSRQLWSGAIDHKMNKILYTDDYGYLMILEI